jgi:hypothetical protein
MADIKSMSLEQAKAYQKELKAQGKTISTSKEAGKLADYIATLQPEKNSDKRLSEAYSKLSSGVTQAGGWTEQNAAQIQQYTGVTPTFQTNKDGTPYSSTEDLSGYLNNYQSSVYGAANNIPLRESIINQLEPQGMEKPDVLNRVEEFEKMRNEMGVADLETTLNGLKAQLEEQYALKRQRTQSAEGKPVAMGVIAGRVSEIERQETERIDAIGRQINVISDQLNTSYNVISTYMQFMSLDYQDAVQRYNDEFNRNLQIYKLVDEEMDQQQATARANLQIYQNALLSGNINYSSLSGDQKAFISKLEVQAGLPIGFTASLKPDEKVLYSGTRESGGVKYLDIITQGANGQPITKSISLGATGSGGSGSSDTRIEPSPNYTPKSEGTVSSGGEWIFSGGSWIPYRNPADMSASERTEISKAKQAILKLGGSQADLDRVEIDPNFRMWVLSR